MGSFNVSCGISGLPIGYDDRAGFVILNNAHEYSKSFGFTPSHGTNLEISSINRYVPLLPPIFGTYDTYGRLEDIEPSPTTELLEKLFHKPIAVLAQCIGNNNNVYAGAIFDNYFIDPTPFQKYYPGDEAYDVALSSVGFVKEDGDNLSYAYEGYRLVRAEHQWQMQVISTGFMALHRINANTPADLLSAFADVTNMFPGFPTEDWKSIKALSKLSGMFFLPEVVTEVATTIDYSEWREDTFMEDWEDFLKSFDINHQPTSQQHGFPRMSKTPFNEEIKTGRRMFASAWGLRTNGFIQKCTSMVPEHYDLLDIYPNGQEFSFLRDVITVADMVNRPLQPSMYVGDDFYEESLISLLDVSRKILDDRKKKWNDDYGYDEEA